MKIPSLGLGLLAAATLTSAASLQQVTSFGSNPTSINFYIYVPDKVATNPAIIVALHPCGGSAPTWYSGTKLPSYADSGGFILIYPGTPHNSNCWDVNNAASLTHNGGGDAAGIISMVNYTLDKYSGDKSRVFVMGSSSGAMMTNVMAGSYPDVFAAGSAYSGVAHACFFGSATSTPFGSNQTCARGLTHTAADWAAFVHNSYPGYTGKYPRMQIWHGLADNLVYPQAGYEALKQWGAVWGLQNAKNNSGVPSSAYTQILYGDGSQVVGYFGQGVGHTAPVNEQNMLQFFGLLT
ncbi:Feruloyl esterase B [Pestalotiopsis fici W106-1]|uniref:Carboxylic ester hydrolase n=1 Tax=Pestalotiopsis fici (strain W106-1 / CGMCC3.15140) TaxID=1229662 RepID=W3WNK5_PESFW|nr:Feruloyl esterase B [Pestalotiopsis fici W106-1]ETS75495.1 Feruloyl esterase B [Pestalotiopsis fici W106-1]